MSLVVDLGTEKMVDLAGAVATGFGAAQEIELSTSFYEVRVFGGAAVVKPGGQPVSGSNLVVVQEAPLRLYVKGKITLAAQGTTPSQAWITRLVEARRE